MDLDFLKDVQKNSHLFQEIEITPEKICPKCNGHFITDNICDACNYNLDYKLLGEPLGERSFYTLRENYRASLTKFETENFKFFRDESKYKHYLNKIKLRYNDLISYFYMEESIYDELRPLYLHELKDLIIELMENGFDESEIWRPVHDKDESGSSSELTLFEKIRDVINEQKREQNLRNYRFIDYKILGMLPISTLLLLLVMLATAVSLSLVFLAYQKYGFSF